MAKLLLRGITNPIFVFLGNMPLGKMVKGEVYAVLFAALAVRILYSASLFPETSTRHTISNQWSRGTRKRGEKKRKSEPTDRKRRLCNATLQQNVWVEPIPSSIK